MAHQSDIGLTDEQRKAITQGLHAAQGKMLDAQWKMEAETEAMSKLLAASPVDESAALAEAEKVMAVEWEFKRAQLSVLILIKNTLTDEQRDRLTALRPEGPLPPPPPMR